MPYPCFCPFASYRVQLSAAIGFRLERRGPQETSLITLRGCELTASVAQDSRVVLSMLGVHSAAEPPANAFFAGHCGRRWLWIDNRDFRSERVFSFLRQLTSLVETDVVGQAPVIAAGKLN